MPPCAALEWERTGWTLEMMPTDAPASAALRAARWPARPAPMTRTSCSGTARDSMHLACALPGRCARGGRLERTSYLIPCDDALQPPIRIDSHQRTEAHQRRGPEQRLQRLVGTHTQAVVVRAQDLRHLEHRLTVIRDALRALAIHDAEEVPVALDDGEPVVAVAQEVLVQRLADRQVTRNRDRVGIHHVGHADSLQARQHGGLVG